MSFNMDYMMITLGFEVGIVAVCYILFQWVHWIDRGCFWTLSGYKYWYVAQWKRSAISLFILAVIIAIAMGFIGGLSR